MSRWTLEGRVVVNAVRLRRWSAADAPFYVQASRDPEIQRFTTDPPDLTVADVRAAIIASAVSMSHDALLICGIRDEDRLGNMAIEYDGRTACISYWVAPAARGQGVAAAALQAAIEHLSREGRTSRAETVDPCRQHRVSCLG